MPASKCRSTRCRSARGQQRLALDLNEFAGFADSDLNHGGRPANILVSPVNWPGPREATFCHQRRNGERFPIGLF